MLRLLDEEPIEWGHEQQTEKGLAPWVRVDLPGADKKSYGIVWREMADGTAKVMYIGLIPLDRLPPAIPAPAVRGSPSRPCAPGRRLLGCRSLNLHSCVVANLGDSPSSL